MDRKGVCSRYHSKGNINRRSTLAFPLIFATEVCSGLRPRVVARCTSRFGVTSWRAARFRVHWGRCPSRNLRREAISLPEATAGSRLVFGGKRPGSTPACHATGGNLARPIFASIRRDARQQLCERAGTRPRQPVKVTEAEEYDIQHSFPHSTHFTASSEKCCCHHGVM